MIIKVFISTLLLAFSFKTIAQESVEELFFGEEEEDGCPEVGPLTIEIVTSPEDFHVEVEITREAVDNQEVIETCDSGIKDVDFDMNIDTIVKAICSENSVCNVKELGMSYVFNGRVDLGYQRNEQDQAYFQRFIVSNEL